MTVGFIGKTKMAAARDCGVRTLSRWIAQGRFPAPQPIGVRKVGWPVEYASMPFSVLERMAKEQAGEVEPAPQLPVPKPRGKARLGSSPLRAEGA
jgi:hypothetical protein